MRPIGFDRANHILMPPPGLEDCDPLSVLQHSQGVISCWEVSAEDLEDIQRTGKIYLNVMVPPGGHPPVWIATDIITSEEEAEESRRGMALLAEKGKAVVH